MTEEQSINLVAPTTVFDGQFEQQFVEDLVGRLKSLGLSATDAEIAVRRSLRSQGACVVPFKV